MPKGHYKHQNAIDITGQRFGDWTVLKRSSKTNSSGQAHWDCRCICGAERPVIGSTLRRGSSRGCGCRADERFTQSLVTHNKSRTPEYRTWIAMRSRCSNPKNTKWTLYGGRGIQVCERWASSFEAFLEDMGPRPSGHSIERIDGDGNYEPANCHWAPLKAQNRNTTRNRFLTHDGETMTIAEWAERTGMAYGTLNNRIRDGWSAADALTIPVGRGSARIAHRLAVTGDTGSL